MISDWIFLSILASILQVIRNSLQKSLQSMHNDLTITWIRFFYGTPIILIYTLIINHGTIPYLMSKKFLFLCALGAIFQIIGTYTLLNCFKKRSFAVGIAFSKLEAPLAAIIGLILFADPLELLGIIGILISVCGVYFLSNFTQNLTLNSVIKQLHHNQTINGIICG